MTTWKALALGCSLLAPLLTGCASTLVPFTQEMRERHGLTDDDMTQLQYYVSNDVKLRREAHTVGRDISEGNLKLREGRTIEEVVIAEATPGVAVAIDGGSITISFEEGSELVFAIRGGEAMPLRAEPSSPFAEAPNPFPEDEVARAPEPLDQLLGNYWLDADSDSMVQFRGRTWNGMEDTFRAHLMIDAESLEEVVETRSVLGGRKLSSSGPRVIFVH
jgi:hypothetical protein